MTVASSPCTTETTDSRVRCERTAHRARREGAVITVPYPYLDRSSVFDKQGKIFKRIASWGIGLPKGGQRNFQGIIASRHVEANAADTRNTL